MLRFKRLLVGVVIVCSLIIFTNGLDENEIKKDEKTVAKRGIFHLGIHGHPVHHHHESPHVHIAPVPIVPKIPVFAKPIIPAAPIPVHPTYHLVPGSATVTSYNVNFPRYPIVPKVFVPPVYPIFPHHHHHHSHGFLPHIHPHSILPLPHHHHHVHPIYPHTHINKPFVPITFPSRKFPFYYHQKPIFVNSLKPQFIPVATPTPTFVPIPVPPEPINPIVPINPGISSTQNQHNVNIFATSQIPYSPPIRTKPKDQSVVPQGNWQPIIMLTKPTKESFLDKYSPFNYHAAMTLNQQSSSSALPSSVSNKYFLGQGQASNQSQYAHQLALYHHHQQQQQHQHQQQHQQQLIEQSNTFPYPPAESFSQNYEAASNDGNYYGQSSYQVPIGAIQK